MLNYNKHSMLRDVSVGYMQVPEAKRPCSTALKGDFQHHLGIHPATFSPSIKMADSTLPSYGLVVLFEVRFNETVSISVRICKSPFYVIM